MKSLKNFTAYQLSKSQMANLRGGEQEMIYYCCWGHNNCNYFFEEDKDSLPPTLHGQAVECTAEPL